MSFRLISTAEAAQMLGIQPQTLRVWRLKGIGPRYRRIGSSVHGRACYLPADIDEWVKQNRFDSTSQETVQTATT